MDMRTWHEIVEGTRKGPLARCAILPLALLSLIYLAAVKLRNLAYDRKIVPTRPLPCPVVSVGNIVAGGTGKSPLVRTLAGELLKRGRRVAILSRGYAAVDRRHPPPLLVSDGHTLLLGARESGDEPVMLARGLPGVIVIADPDRVRAGRMAVKRFGADLLILDDGFQHRRAARDIDILLVDYERPFGNGKVLPAGPLREPPESIARADIIVLTRCETDKPERSVIEALRRLNPRAALFTARHVPVHLRKLPSGSREGLDYLEGKRIAAFSGVARPDDFEKALSRLGAAVVHRRVFPDHHYFNAQELGKIIESARRAGADALITTAKDTVRLPDRLDQSLPLFCLEIEMRIATGEYKLIESVLRLLKERQA